MRTPGKKAPDCDKSILFEEKERILNPLKHSLTSITISINSLWDFLNINVSKSYLASLCLNMPLAAGSVKHINIKLATHIRAKADYDTTKNVMDEQTHYLRPQSARYSPKQCHSASGLRRGRLTHRPAQLSRAQPITRLNAFLNALSDSYPSDRAMCRIESPEC